MSSEIKTIKMSKIIILLFINLVGVLSIRAEQEDIDSPIMFSKEHFLKETEQVKAVVPSRYSMVFFHKYIQNYKY